MITEDYVSLETARLLKEKGFDVNCIAKYRPDNNIGYWSVEGLNAPTIQMAMKWLRKEHKLEIYPFHYKEYSRDKWGYNIKKEMPFSVIYKFQMPAIINSYEEACDAAIQYCLVHLI